jgi:hypothetical protein
LPIVLLSFCIYDVCVMCIGLNAEDLSDGRGVEAMKLVAWAGTEVENNTTCGADERGDYGCVFVGNEAGGYASWSA